MTAIFSHIWATTPRSWVIMMMDMPLSLIHICWYSSKIVSDTITLLLLEDSSAAYAAYNSGEAQLVKDAVSYTHLDVYKRQGQQIFFYLFWQLL